MDRKVEAKLIRYQVVKAPAGYKSDDWIDMLEGAAKLIKSWFVGAPVGDEGGSVIDLLEAAREMDEEANKEEEAGKAIRDGDRKFEEWVEKLATAIRDENKRAEENDRGGEKEADV